MGRTGAMQCALLLAVLCAALGQAAAQAFLGEQLPLRPLVTTPSELLTSDPNTTVTLLERQAITVGGG